MLMNVKIEKLKNLSIGFSIEDQYFSTTLDKKTMWRWFLTPTTNDAKSDEIV